MRRAAFFALAACALVACRYDYDALMGTGKSGAGGSHPGTGGDVALGGRGQGGSVGARGGAGGDGDGGGPGAGGRGGDNGAAGTSGGAGDPAGRGGTSGAGRGGTSGVAGGAGAAGSGGVIGSGGGGAAGLAGTSGARGGAGGDGGGGTTGAGGAAASDPVLWYRFDDGTGMVALDSSTAAGAPHNGTITAVGTGSATFSTTHQVGTGALSLSGTNSTNGAYVSIPAGINALGATTAITVACWVNVTTDRAWGRVFDFGNTSTTGYMFLTTYQAQNTPSSVRFAITATNNAAEQQITSTARLSTGVWHHLAVVLDVGATYTGTLYVDGAVAGTNAAMTLRPSNLGNTTNNWIGRSTFTADPYFAGLVDDFRVYNRALTASEIAALFTTVR